MKNILLSLSHSEACGLLQSIYYSIDDIESMIYDEKEDPEKENLIAEVSELKIIQEKLLKLINQ